MTSFVFRWQMTVEFGHCDPAGMVSPKRLFEYFDTGTWSLFEAALGVKRADFITTFGILPLVDVHLDCRKTVKFGDSIEIASRVAEFRRSSFDVLITASPSAASSRSRAEKPVFGRRVIRTIRTRSARWLFQPTSSRGSARRLLTN